MLGPARYFRLGNRKYFNLLSGSDYSLCPFSPHILCLVPVLAPGSYPLDSLPLLPASCPWPPSSVAPPLS
ncbi:hypothetical protein EYF80_025829 [Liparis tanakae]|uniref:Uncharacterized protein n=1 Tax=Liparis tanakae TaxID=230148 RepID=A0A4Z2HDN9_9TELE|nr:hypothetical protein EYF80_025829 [Liparis tanakae]